MTDSVPLSLYITNRAQCPDCGAPLSLVKDKPLIECSFCGGHASVERRLRTTEITIENLETSSGPAQWKPAHQIAGHQMFEPHCPTCGVEMQTNAHHTLARCPQCRIEVKIEQRLVRSGATGVLALEELADRWQHSHNATE